jgi:hypothetical protein
MKSGLGEVIHYSSSYEKTLPGGLVILRHQASQGVSILNLLASNTSSKLDCEEESVGVPRRSSREHNQPARRVMLDT